MLLGLLRAKNIDILTYRNIILCMSEKKVFNIRLEAELIAEMKIQAIREGRTVSAIATELFREYLRKKKPK
jgi:hypothetical protein